MLAVAGAFHAIDAAPRCDAGSRLEINDDTSMSL
jgi:hypothetical protein